MDSKTVHCESETTDAVKIVLVEWAAYPPQRDKLVGQQMVRCGLGRTLENMQRHAPGMPAEVLVVINAATELAGQRSERQQSQGLQSRGKWRRRLKRLVELQGQ